MPLTQHSWYNNCWRLWHITEHSWCMAYIYEPGLILNALRASYPITELLCDCTYYVRLMPKPQHSLWMHTLGFQKVKGKSSCIVEGSYSWCMDSGVMYRGRLTPLNQHVYMNVLWLIQSSKTELMVSVLGVAQVYNPACTVLDYKQ